MLIVNFVLLIKFYLRFAKIVTGSS